MWMSRFLPLLAGSLLLALPAHAVPITSVDNMRSIRLFEVSGAQTTLFNIQTGVNLDLATVERTGRLSFSNSDFQSNAGEFYDFYFSDADGTFNAAGAFFSIAAIFDSTATDGLNIARVDIAFTDNTTEVANVVSSFFASNFGGPFGLANALDGDLATFTRLGNTLGPGAIPLPEPLRITLGFASSAPMSIPGPPAFLLLLTGLAALRLFAKRPLLSRAG